jgi:hypothetical protein
MPYTLPVTLAVIVRGAAVVVVLAGAVVVLAGAVVVGPGSVVVVGPPPEAVADAASKLKIVGAAHTPPATAAPSPRARRRLNIGDSEATSAASLDSIGSDIGVTPERYERTNSTNSPE